MSPTPVTPLGARGGSKPPCRRGVGTNPKMAYPTRSRRPERLPVPDGIPALGLHRRPACAKHTDSALGVDRRNPCALVKLEHLADVGPGGPRLREVDVGFPPVCKAVIALSLCPGELLNRRTAAPRPRWCGSHSRPARAVQHDRHLPNPRHRFAACWRLRHDRPGRGGLGLKHRAFADSWRINPLNVSASRYFWASSDWAVETPWNAHL
jgi:hypothetical protein